MKKKSTRWIEHGIYRTSPNGKYRIDITMPKSDGSKIRVRKAVSTSLKETRRELQALRKKLEMGICYIPNTSITLKEIINKFNAHTKANHNKVSSITRDAIVFKHLEKYFGPNTKMVPFLARTKIEEYMNQRRSEGASEIKRIIPIPNPNKKSLKSGTGKV